MPQSVLTFLKNNGLVLVLAGAFFAYTQFQRAPEPPEASLTVAARSYLRNLPQAYAAARDGVRDGSIRSRDGIIEVANAKAAEPMANALIQAIAPGCDPNSKDGTITNPSLVASVLDDLVRGLR